MRENESDSEDGWQQPGEYISPWAPRDAGEADQASGDSWGFGDRTGAAPRPENEEHDTVALDRPPYEAGGYGRGAGGRGADGQDPYGQRGYADPWYSDAGNEASYGSYRDPGEGGGSYGDLSGYGSSTGEGGYGEGGYRQGGYGEGGYGAGGYPQGGYGAGGDGTAGWELPSPPPPRRFRRGGHFLVYAAVAALAAGIGAGIAAALANHDAGSSAGISSSNVPAPHNNAAGSGSSSTLNPGTVEKKVEPGLVDIISTLKYDSETAEGTGMILSASGLVLTNNHVIDGATNVRVLLADDRDQTYRARVVGYDSADDVALLQLADASGLATVSFGNSSQIRIGTPVLALGNAEGRGGVTPAAGYIEALNRSIQASDEGSGTTESLNHMLQTNAQIQQGDSGGALANNAGQVIGMVTAANTAGPGQFGQGGGTIGFAIPIDSALAIAKQIDEGHASSSIYIGLPGFLGVEVAQSDSPNPQQQAASEQQSGNGPQVPGGPAVPGGNGSGCVVGGQTPGAPASIAPASTGALIVGTLCGTAAQSRGLAPGDVITSVDGQAVTTPGSLTSITARYHPGDVVSIGWESTSGARHTTSIRLGSGPAR